VCLAHLVCLACLAQACTAAAFALSGGQLAESHGWRYVLLVMSSAGVGSVACMQAFFGHALRAEAEAEGSKKKAKTN
jgi:hypothetical protein